MLDVGIWLRAWFNHRMLGEFRKIDPEMPIQVAMVFAVVANAGEISQADIVKMVGIAQSSVSRNLGALGKINRFYKPGHDLVEQIDDPMNRSRRIVRLTRKGHALAKALAADPVA